MTLANIHAILNFKINGYLKFFIFNGWIGTNGTARKSLNVPSPSRDWGKAGGHKPQHFTLSCHILSLMSSGSHEPQPFRNF